MSTKTSTIDIFERNKIKVKQYIDSNLKNPRLLHDDVLYQFIVQLSHDVIRKTGTFVHNVRSDVRMSLFNYAKAYMEEKGLL